MPCSTTSPSGSAPSSTTCAARPSTSLLANPELPNDLRQLLEVRQQASTTSTSKYKALVNAATDGRVRGTLQYCGASRTGRWAGRTFQPQNLPSRDLLPQSDIELGIDALKAGVAHYAYDNVMALVSSCIRSCAIAPPGKKLSGGGSCRHRGPGARVAGRRGVEA
jgi:DNA polymerase